MHNYLRSIGFSNIVNKREVDHLINDIVKNPDKKMITEDDYGNVFAELSREFGRFIGIAVRGEYVDTGPVSLFYWEWSHYGRKSRSGKAL